MGADRKLAELCTSLIDEREKGAIRTAYLNAAVVSAGLAGGPRRLPPQLRYRGVSG